MIKPLPVFHGKQAVISCGCCASCEWDMNVPGHCHYGGPFVGYRLPDGSMVRWDEPPRGLFHTLTPAQQAKVLAYDGPESIGPSMQETPNDDAG